MAARSHPRPSASACGLIVPVLHVIFYCPRIPGNSGAAIRLSANTGSMLHLVDPLFDMDDVKLRRAGLNYHDLASTRTPPRKAPHPKIPEDLPPMERG